MAKLVNRLLGGERRGRRTGRAVRGRLGNVGHHVIALNKTVGDFVRSKHGAAAAGDGGAGESAGFIDQRRLRCGEAPVTSAADLHLDVAAGGGSGAGEDLGAGHGDLDRPTDLAGQRGDHGLQVATTLTLAAEAAADLHWDDVELTNGNAEDSAGVVTQREMALAAGPNRDGIVVIPTSGGRVGLNITLVDLTGVVLTFHDGVGFGETGLQITQGCLEVVGYVGTVASVGFGPPAGTLGRVGQRYQPFVNQGRAWRHGFVGRQHGGQDFPVHVDEGQGLFGQMGRVGGDGGDGMALVKRLLAGHHVAAVEAVVDGGPFFLVLDLGGNFGEVCGGDHDVDAGQGQRPAGVDAADAGVGVGTPQDLAVEHPRQVDVGGVASAPHHLVRPVVAHRTGAYHLIVFIGIGEDDIRFVVKHKRQSPCARARQCDGRNLPQTDAGVGTAVVC